MLELSSAEWGMTENIHQKVEVVRSGGKGNGVIGKKQRADQQQLEWDGESEKLY